MRVVGCRRWAHDAVVVSSIVTATIENKNLFIQSSYGLWCRRIGWAIITPEPEHVKPFLISLAFDFSVACWENPRAEFEGIHVRLKTFVLATLTLIIPAAPALATHFELVPFVGGRFGGGFYGGNYGQTSLNSDDLKVNNGFNFGVLLDIEVRDQLQIELLFDRQNTSVTRFGSSGEEQRSS